MVGRTLPGAAMSPGLATANSTTPLDCSANASTRDSASPWIRVSEGDVRTSMTESGWSWSVRVKKSRSRQKEIHTYPHQTVSQHSVLI